MALDLTKVQHYIQEIEAELIEVRRDLHMHPELGYEEIRTGKIIGDRLEGLGLDVQRGLAKTGIVATLKGDKAGSTIALRADMDALSMEDKKDVAYASQISGKAHACGHDVHTTVLLGVAMVLSRFKKFLSGEVKFIFQPAEEGPGGAEPLIREGVLDGVDVIYGMHTWSHGEIGEVGISRGPSSASADEIEIGIIGRGGHGAYPHLGVDAIHLTGLVLTALHTLASRFVDPLEPNVITIGKINGGYRRNIIADHVQMSGTVRTYSQELRNQLKEQIEKTISGVTKAFGGDFTYEYKFGYPPLINHLAQVDSFSRVVAELPYDFRLLERKPAMGGEDFAYYLQKVPGAFFYLGTKSSEKTAYPGHHPLFDVDERAIGLGVLIFVGLVKDFLEK